MNLKIIFVLAYLMQMTATLRCRNRSSDL